MLNKTSWVHLASLLAVFVSTFISIATVQAKPLTRSEIGEFFLFGIHDTKVDTKTEKHLTHLCPGSLLLFRRNLVSNQQTAELTKKLRALHATCSKQPLLIGLDQEGGQVARIPFDPPMPSPWAVGVTKDPEIANALGFQVGSTLRQLGFNMNLAPVLDLGHATKKSFIGSRSYGADPELVSKMGAAFSKGLAQAGVLPVAKHFPGIGEVPNDPHQALVRRGSTSQQLWQKDLLPFRKFAEISPSGIMPSHLIYTSTEQAAGPGTFSKTLLQGWLREKIRFNGLIISDDLLMKGAQGNKILNRNVISALQAGVDLIMIT